MSRLPNKPPPSRAGSNMQRLPSDAGTAKAQSHLNLDNYRATKSDNPFARAHEYQIRSVVSAKDLRRLKAIERQKREREMELLEKKEVKQDYLTFIESINKKKTKSKSSKKKSKYIIPDKLMKEFGDTPIEAVQALHKAGVSGCALKWLCRYFQHGATAKEALIAVLSKRATGAERVKFVSEIDPERYRWVKLGHETRADKRRWSSGKASHTRRQSSSRMSMASEDSCDSSDSCSYHDGSGRNPFKHTVIELEDISIPPNLIRPIKQSAGIQVAVLPKTYPQISLDIEALISLEEVLVEEIALGWCDKLQFEDSCFKKGCLMIFCANAATVKWVFETVSKFRSESGIDLKAIMGDYSPDALHISLFLPDGMDQPLEKTLAFLATQNADININAWTLLGRWDEESGQLLMFEVDEGSMDAIKRNNNTLYYRFATINVMEGGYRL